MTSLKISPKSIKLKKPMFSVYMVKHESFTLQPSYLQRKSPSIIIGLRQKALAEPSRT
jgi:hypothetical protein